MYSTTIARPEADLKDFFDLEELHELCFGDSNLLREIVREFIDCIPYYLLTLRESLEHGNTTELTNQACHLRGTTSLCSVYKVPDMCRILENYASQGNLLAAKSSYYRLERYLNLMSDLYKILL